MLDIQHPMHLIQDLSLPQIWPYHQHPTCMPEPYHGSIARRYSSLTPFDRSGLSAPTQDTPSTPVQNPPSTLQHLPAEPPAPPPPSDAIRRLRDGSKTLSAFAIFVFPVALSLTVAILGLLKPSTTHGHSERPALFYLSVSCRALSVALSLLSTLLYSFVRDIWDETDPRVTTSFQIAAVVCYGSAATLTATLVMVPALFVSHWVAVLTGVIFGSLFVVEMYAFYKGVRHYRYM